MNGSLRRNTMILIVSLAAILVLYLLFFWLPQRRNSALMLGTIQKRRGEIDRCRQQADQLPMLNGELEQLESYNRQVAERIPAVLDVREFLKTMHGLGQQHAVTISTWSPSLASDLVGIKQQPVSLTVVGKFQAIVKMIYDLEAMDRLVELTDLDMKVKDVAGRAEDMVEAKLSVRLFARPPKSPANSQNNS